MKTFSKHSMGKKIACFGIGDYFHKIIESYSEYDWIENVVYLIDNNSSIQNRVEKVGNKYLKVMSFSELAEISADNLVFFITVSKGYYEISRQLNCVSKFDECECYFYDLMFALHEHGKLTIKQTEKPIIPPIIHYCWFGHGEMPTLYKACIESWRRYCPEYEIRKWDENSCDLSENRYAMEAYESGKYGFVPDFFRLKIIYENGGIYMDTDVEAIRSFDDLRYNEGFCGLQYPWMAALGLGFGAVKGNEVIGRMMESYKSIPFICEDGSFNETVSGIYQTKVLENMGMKKKNSLQTLEGMTIFPTEVLSPKNSHTGMVDISVNTYAIHHFDGSWLGIDMIEANDNRASEAAKIMKLIKEK